MKDSFNGIEEYKNAFDKAYCKQLIDLFEERSKMQLTEHQRSGKNQDERIRLCKLINLQEAICHLLNLVRKTLYF